LDTEYIAPKNGIKYPSQAGDYACYLTLKDATSTTLESTSFFFQVRAPKLRNFDAWSYVEDIGEENLFVFDFEVDTHTYPRSYTDGTQYSRIFLKFPTVDSLGNALFQDDLGGYS